MTKSFLTFLLLLLVGGLGGYWYLHQDDNRLRMDVCQLRGKQGPLSDGATLHVGDPLQLTVTLRGCRADSVQICKAQVSTRVEGPVKSLPFLALGPTGKPVDLNELAPFDFRKNSPLTSMEVKAAGQAPPPGAYLLTVVAEDLVAHRKVEKQFRFQVEAL